MKRVLAVAILCAIRASATSYYVDSVGGSDTNPGTSPSFPWRTIARVNAGSYNPADTILFLQGDTWSGTTLTTPSAGGGPTSRIVYGSYGTSGISPVFNGNSIVISKNYIAIAGINIQNISGTGINFSNTTGTLITGVVATNVNNWAFKGYQVGSSMVDSSTCTSTAGFVELSGCIIMQVNGATPQTATLTATHNSCHFENLNKTSSGSNVICVEFGGPVATNSRIQYNFANGGVQFGGFKPGSCTGAGTADVCFGQVKGGLIADNEIHNVIFFGVPGSTTIIGDGETIELEGAPTAIQTGVIVTRNVVSGSQSTGGTTGGTNTAGSTNDLVGLFEAQGNFIFANVFTCPCGNQSAIKFETNAGGNFVYNNTIRQGALNTSISNIPTQTGIIIGTDTGEVIKNNIISGYSRGISGSASNTSDYNLFTTTVPTPVIGGIAAGAHSLTGIQAATVFVVTPPTTANDSKLIAGSPAIGTGVNLGANFANILSPGSSSIPYAIFTQGTSWEMGAFGFPGTIPAVPTILSGAVVTGATVN